MPVVRFERENKTVEVEDGESLRYVALDNDVPATRFRYRHRAR